MLKFNMTGKMDRLLKMNFLIPNDIYSKVEQMFAELAKNN